MLFADYQLFVQKMQVRWLYVLFLRKGNPPILSLIYCQKS